MTLCGASTPGSSETSLFEHRLVLYIVAGVSAAPPSNRPMGSGVADRLRHPAAAMLGCGVEDLAGETLEEIASKVAALGAEQLARLRSLAATSYDFAGLEPNSYIGSHMPLTVVGALPDG
jgi:hypothetical protein